MNHEDLLKRMNEGSEATLALNIMGPIFDKCEGELVGSLKACFREGKYTELVLASHVAQLVAIDNLRDKLKGIQRTGMTSRDQIDKGDYDGAPEQTE